MRVLALLLFTATDSHGAQGSATFGLAALTVKDGRVRVHNDWDARPRDDVWLSAARARKS